MKFVEISLSFSSSILSSFISSSKFSVIVYDNSSDFWLCKLYYFSSNII